MGFCTSTHTDVNTTIGDHDSCHEHRFDNGRHSRHTIIWFVMGTYCLNYHSADLQLGHNHPVEIRKLIEILEDALGVKANIEHLDAVAGEMPVTHADLSKAQRLLGYAPKFPLADGVAEFVAWYREIYR